MGEHKQLSIAWVPQTLDGNEAQLGPVGGKGPFVVGAPLRSPS